jgi:hypothetical protein
MMRKRTARKLRRIADRLDPKPTRWYQTGTTVGNVTYTTSGIQQSQFMTFDFTTKRPHRRVLADYLTAPDLQKLRP